MESMVTTEPFRSAITSSSSPRHSVQGVPGATRTGCPLCRMLGLGSVHRRRSRSAQASTTGRDERSFRTRCRKQPSFSSSWLKSSAPGGASWASSCRPSGVSYCRFVASWQEIVGNRVSGMVTIAATLSPRVRQLCWPSAIIGGVKRRRVDPHSRQSSFTGVVPPQVHQGTLSASSACAIATAWAL